MDLNEFRSHANETVQRAFTEQHVTAMGVEEEMAHLKGMQPLRAATYQKTLARLDTHDGVSLQHEDASPWTVPIAVHIDRASFTAENLSGTHLVPAQYDDVPAAVTYDISCELEKAGSVTLSLAASHVQREQTDALLRNVLTESSVYRLGHVPSYIFLDMDGFYTRNRFKNDPSLADVFPYMTRKRRYLDHLKSHGPRVMAVGGTNSIQVTMRPRMENVDRMFRDFYSGIDGAGIPALSPLFYAPFMNSPVLDAHDALQTHMGREDAYEISLTPSPYVNTDGTRKWGFVPELAHIDGAADAITVFMNKYMQFSAGVPASDLVVLDESGPRGTFIDHYRDRYDAFTGKTEVHVRVGVDEPMTFADFVAQETFDGIITLPATGEEIGEEVIVHADYTDLDADAFKHVAWKHFLAHSTGVWPNYRPRFGAGAIECRDYGTSPRVREAIDTQAAINLVWRDLQQFAHQHLDVTNADAEALRAGVAEHGLLHELPSGHTVREVWTGIDGNGVLDMLTEGVRQASYSLPEDGTYTKERKRYAQRYRERMEAYLAKGSFSRVFAQLVQEEGREAALEKTRAY